MPARRIKQFDKDDIQRGHRSHRSKRGYNNEFSSLWKEHNKPAPRGYKGNRRGKT